MRKHYAATLIFCMLFFMVGCNPISKTKISVEAKVSKLSDKQFEEVGTEGLKNSSKDDFRKFTFNFKMENPPDTSRKIEFPKGIAWKKSINSVDGKVRYWFGEEYQQDNEDENFALYHKDFLFYSKGLSEDEIKEAFDSIILKVAWKTKEKYQEEKEYQVSKLIKFN
ncbi:fructose-bisphosphate aldolase [Fictibacillus sp. S7]|uniref:fructose-bisphosphate aldolase n=1 Tax=Fictibacillus sp. S7 TaxID=2212476 RepID=UPI001010FF03|nr:fructose-bisphosphate aldolase [Fictibacillus sp. S7]RXY98879.1 fructose-bisphosphate aldolase [Fictibacillus sp. S7]